jgi:hypothetical protein
MHPLPMINVRKLAALDLQVLGHKLILTEFGLGVAGSAAVGVVMLRAGIQRFHSRQMIVFGAYLILLGINYVPLLLHAMSMVRGGSALQAAVSWQTNVPPFASTGGSRCSSYSPWSCR